MVCDTPQLEPRFLVKEQLHVRTTTHQGIENVILASLHSGWFGKAMTFE